MLERHPSVGARDIQRGHVGERLLTERIGDEIFALAAKIFPICRSITGNGVRQTLREIAAHIALEMHEVPTGTPVFDWTIPREWNIRDAYIKDSRGEKIVDFAWSNLHVVSYSVPVRKLVSLAELRQHVHTLPEQPDLIPYRTSYYSEDWGFCMPHRQFEQLQDEIYEVVIDSSLEDGNLSYGEYLHRGETEDEFLLSAHVCHPSLANDNCAGIALLTHLAKRITELRTRYSYRFLFAPGTIGAITWLACNEDNCQRIKHGLVVSMVGDGGGPTYKKSRRGNAKIDRAMIHCSPSFRIDANYPRFCSVRLRRTPILFARFQLAGRAFPTRQVRQDSRISYLGRQSPIYTAESLSPVFPPNRRNHRCDRKRRDLLQYDTEMRTAARQARPL